VVTVEGNHDSLKFRETEMSNVFHMKNDRYVINKDEYCIIFLLYKQCSKYVNIFDL
jgi:hypothetical protein